MEIITLIGAIGTLAGAVVGVWREIEEGKRRKLDREHAAFLQRAQHEHERLLADVRPNGHPVLLVNNGQDNSFIPRLEKEAEYLSALNFEVVFEALDYGYAIALPLSEAVVLVLWLSPDYPKVSPRVLTWTSSEIDEVEFSPGSWDEDRTLAEVVSALAPHVAGRPGYGNDFQGELK